MVREKTERHRLMVAFPKPLFRRLGIVALTRERTLSSLVIEAVEASVEIMEQEHRCLPQTKK